MFCIRIVTCLFRKKYILLEIKSSSKKYSTVSYYYKFTHRALRLPINLAEYPPSVAV